MLNKEGQEIFIKEGQEIEIILGVVEKLLKEFERNVFSTRDLGKTFMNNYLKKVDYWTS